MRAAGIQIAGALHHGKATLVEYVAQPREPRVQTKRLSAAVAANLEYLTGRNRERRSAAVVERILVRNNRAQGVVAAIEVHDDKISTPHALRERNVAQKGRSSNSRR